MTTSVTVTINQETLNSLTAQGFTLGQVQDVVEELVRKDKKKLYDQKHYREHRDVLLAYSRRYVHEHTDERRRYRQQYNCTHQERVRAVIQQWQQEHPKELKAANERYNLTHPGAHQVATEKYNRLHPEKHKVTVHNNRARRRGAEGSWTIQEWQVKLAECGHKCVYCSTLAEDTPEGKLTPDHLLPIVRGGSNCIDNVAPACRQCNNEKSMMTAEEFLASIDAGKEVGVLTRRYINRHPEVRSIR